MRSQLLVALLADRSGAAKQRQAGFALLLSLFVGLAVVLGWLMLAARTSSSRLGAALQSENREARLVAESAIDVVINELNQPPNRMLLAYGQDLGKWQNSASFANSCTNANNQPPSNTIATLGRGEFINLPTVSANDRLSRRFKLINVRLMNSNRQPLASPNDINLRAPRGFGYIELEVEGQVLRNGVPAATTRITREYQVVPKCCNRSFRGPGNPDLPRDPNNFYLQPGLYGNDERPCPDGFPQFLLGAANNDTRNTGGLRFVIGQAPEIRSREDPTKRPDKILCFTKFARCTGERSADNVPVLPTNRVLPKVPVLGTDGVPCAETDLTCIEAGINKARSGEFTARPIDLITQNDRDYIRVNSDGKVEICNKSSTKAYVEDWKYGNGNVINWASLSAPRREQLASQITVNQDPNIKKNFDPSTEIDTSTCELMMGNNDASKNVCAEQNINGFKTYHCRIKNIYVNDTGAEGISEDLVRQNNSLFIDSSNGPIYLYVNEDWAATSLDQASAAVQAKWNADKAAFSNHNAYTALFTSGRYDDGQIQHVYCGPVNGKTPPGSNQACADKAPAEITSRAAIVSACRRRFNQDLGKAEEDCRLPDNTNSVTATIADDGFVRDMFLFMPNSTITISGDPFGDNEAQGKPQVAAVVWADRLQFINRSTELYVPGENAQFFGLETSPDDRYNPLIFDYIARSITSSFLFRR